MKWLCLVILTLSSSVFAYSECPQDNKIIAKCTANAWVPLYPYIWVCQDAHSNYSLSLNAGRDYVDNYEVTTEEDERQISFTAIDPEASKLNLTIEKKTLRGVFSFDGVLGFSKKYTCK